MQSRHGQGVVAAQVGRPRPDFMARCWPDGAQVTWNKDGTPACAASAVRPDEGRKSFPSGARLACCSSCMVSYSLLPFMCLELFPFLRPAKTCAKARGVRCAYSDKAHCRMIQPVRDFLQATHPGLQQGWATSASGWQVLLSLLRDYTSVCADAGD